MKKETSPNIAFIADRFSQVDNNDAVLEFSNKIKISRWIASELLTTPNSKQRSKIIGQVINLAQVCRKKKKKNSQFYLVVRDLKRKQ